MKETTGKQELLWQINNRVALLAAGRGVAQPCSITDLERLTNERAPANWTWHGAARDVSAACSGIIGEVVAA